VTPYRTPAPPVRRHDPRPWPWPPALLYGSVALGVAWGASEELARGAWVWAGFAIFLAVALAGWTGLAMWLEWHWFDERNPE